MDDLRSLSTNPDLELFDPKLKLTYGTQQGSVRLRQRVADLHSSEQVKITADDVLITPGSIMANYSVLGALCGSGDHIICQYPTFGPLYLIPQYGGVEVGLWRMREDREWTLCLEELAGMIKPNTKAIILNNPNNPTGAVLPRDFLLQVIEAARKANITVFTDEVFSPLFFTQPRPPSFVSLGYTDSVVTGSMSKSYGIPGIRIGWIISQHPELMARVRTARNYTTISISQLDDAVAAYALNEAVLPSLMKRNLALCSESIGLLEDFVQRNSTRTRWIQPAGAGTAFLQVLHQDGTPVDDVAFSRMLADEEDVGVTPGGYGFSHGHEHDFKGYLRITLGSPDVLRESLPLLERFIQRFGLPVDRATLNVSGQ